MKKRTVVRLVAVLFAVAVLSAWPLSALAGTPVQGGAYTRAGAENSGEGQEGSGESAPEEKEGQTTAAEEPETPRAMPAPEEPLHLSYPASVFCTFLVVLAVVVVVRLLVKRNNRARQEKKTHSLHQ